MKNTLDNPFIGRYEHYSMNVEGAYRTYARAAFMDGPAGKKPAIAIFRDRALLTLLPPDEAIRIAHEIADAVQAQKQTTA